MPKGKETGTECVPLIYYDGASQRALDPAIVSISPRGTIAIGESLYANWRKDRAYVRLAKFEGDSSRLVLESATLEDRGSLRLRPDGRVTRFDAKRALAFLGLLPTAHLHASAQWRHERLVVDLAGAARIERPSRVSQAAVGTPPTAGAGKRPRVTCPACGRDCAAVPIRGGALRPYLHRDPEGVVCRGKA